MKITKCTYGWIKRLAICDHCANLLTTTKCITNIWNKSPAIPYYGQRFWPWNIFKRLCVIPLLQSGLCDGRSAVTSLEHKCTDISQHLLLAFGE
jgi:hypothetical protein